MKLGSTAFLVIQLLLGPHQGHVVAHPDAAVLSPVSSNSNSNGSTTPTWSSIEELATHTESMPPATYTGSTDSRPCVECIVQRMVPIADLNLSKQQAAEATSQLVEVLKALVDKQAMLLSRPREEVYSQIMSLVRAQAIQPRFNPRAMYGIVGTDERRFFERILDLFRDFITAFVNNALDNILSSASSAAPAAQQTSAANPNSTASTRSRSMSKSKSKSRSKSQSDKDDDDGDDDGDDGDGDDSDK